MVLSFLLKRLKILQYSHGVGWGYGGKASFLISYLNEIPKPKMSLYLLIKMCAIFQEHRAQGGTHPQIAPLEISCWEEGLRVLDSENTALRSAPQVQSTPSSLEAPSGQKQQTTEKNQYYSNQSKFSRAQMCMSPFELFHFCFLHLTKGELTVLSQKPPPRYFYAQASLGYQGQGAFLVHFRFPSGQILMGMDSFHR